MNKKTPNRFLKLVRFIKNIKMKNIFSMIKFTALIVILFAVLYPLAIYGIAKLAPNQGKGETVSVNGKVVGYQKIGQKFYRHWRDD